QDDVLYRANLDPHSRDWKVCIPKGIRKLVMQNVHDSPSGGHFGFYKTYTLIKERYDWPSMYKDIKKYTLGCPTCQLYNRRTTPATGPLAPWSPPMQPFSRIHIDFLGPYKRSKRGNKYILNIVDHLTRYTEGIPMSAATSEKAIKAIKEFIIY